MNDIDEGHRGFDGVSSRGDAVRLSTQNKFRNLSSGL